MGVGPSPGALQGDPAKALKQFKLPADVIAPMLRTAMTSQDPWVRQQATDVFSYPLGTSPGTSRCRDPRRLHGRR